MAIPPIGPTPDITPDTVGFSAAQDRLRELLGVDATFIITAAAVWPAGTQLDPESGKPYDPFLEPEVPGAVTEVTLRCSFAHRPFTPGMWGGLDTPNTPIGTVDRGISALIVAYADYPSVKDAARVRVADETWDVEVWRSDVLAGHNRWIVYLEHA
jgi:hypothetical protein